MRGHGARFARVSVITSALIAVAGCSGSSGNDSALPTKDGKKVPSLHGVDLTDRTLNRKEVQQALLTVHDFEYGWTMEPSEDENTEESDEPGGGDGNPGDSSGSGDSSENEPDSSVQGGACRNLLLEGMIDETGEPAVEEEREFTQDSAGRSVEVSVSTFKGDEAHKYLEDERKTIEVCGASGSGMTFDQDGTTYELTIAEMATAERGDETLGFRMSASPKDSYEEGITFDCVVVRVGRSVAELTFHGVNDTDGPLVESIVDKQVTKLTQTLGGH